MLYRCRACGITIAAGWLPMAPCGPLALYLALAGFGAATQLTQAAWPYAGWWAVLLWPVLFVAALWLLAAAVRMAEWLWVSPRRCPCCGRRAWSRLANPWLRL
jgi:hypothetical protein